MIVAYTALGLWVLLALVLFAILRPAGAAAASLIGGAMFLPERVAFDVLGLPPIGKDEVTVLACLLACMVFAFPELRRARIGRGPEILLLVFAFGSLVTVLLNQHEVVSGATVMPGTRPSDFVTDIAANWLVLGVPFFLGRALFSRSQDLRAFFIVLVVAGLVYSLFILVELRMSPQFHRWTYGFHQHGFVQTIRDSGYRPMVFMRHGLHLALFVFLAMTAAMAMTRGKLALFGVPSAVVSVYLTAMLVLCKSVGALVYGLATAPLVLLTSPRLQSRAAVVIAIGIIAYPAVRAADLIPLETVRSVAESFAGPTRARSLVGRMETETEVMMRANERPIFGWASAGRTMTFDETRPNLSLTTYDGVWLVLYSKGGIVRLASVFGLLLVPVFAAARSLPKIRSPLDRALVSGLSLMICINVFDLLPNSTTEPYLTLMSGILSGAVPGILRAQGRRSRTGAPGGLRLRSGGGLAEGLLTGSRATRSLRGARG